MPNNDKNEGCEQREQYEAFWYVMKYFIPLYLSASLVLWGVWITQGSPKIAANKVEIRNLKEQVQEVKSEIEILKQKPPFPVIFPEVVPREITKKE